MINFDHFTCCLQTSNSNKGFFTIEVEGQQRKFELRAGTKEEADDWIEEIEMHINSSDGGRQQKIGDKILKPWKYNTISEKQFIKAADTGDILLFKSKGMNSRFIRTVTGGQFDHVAMVLKFESDPNEVYLIDATGNRGVCLNKWSFIRNFIGPNQFYRDVVFRHVEIERTNDMVDALEIFLKEVIGRKYGLGNKLFRRKTAVTKKLGNCKLIEEERTFFCSELIAKAFKVLGII